MVMKTLNIVRLIFILLITAVIPVRGNAEDALATYFVESWGGNAFAKSCSKGCACGASCISCSYTCHVNTYTPPPTTTTTSPPVTSTTVPPVTSTPTVVVPLVPEIRKSIASVNYLVDGDTLDLMTDTGKIRGRLVNIDAPERTQVYGLEAKQCLAAIIAGATLTYVEKGKDRYGRSLVKVYANGLDVSAEMVRRGCAWVYDQYNDDSSLPALQATAKASLFGLWANPYVIAPWQFRNPSTPTPDLERIAAWAEYKYPSFFKGNAGTSTGRWVWPDSSTALGVSGNNSVELQCPALGFIATTDIGSVAMWLALAAQDGF